MLTRLMLQAVALSVLGAVCVATSRFSNLNVLSVVQSCKHSCIYRAVNTYCRTAHMFVMIKNRLWSFTLKILQAVNCSFELVQSDKHMSLFNEGPCVHVLKSERTGLVFQNYHTFSS